MEAEMGSFFSQLPVEITTDILSRLPVGSVIRCKVICKAWQSLVKDPVFLDIHTSRLLLKPADAAAAAVTTNTTEFYLTVRQLQENRQNHHFWECNNNHELSTSSRSSCFKLSKPLNAKDKWYDSHPIGSSNGLICSYGKNRGGTIYVYNPCTRECIRLPPKIFSRQPKVPLLQGFGYNPLMNEYKVVLILPNRDEEDRPQPGAEVCVYTLGSGKWRRTANKQLESWSLNVSFKQGLFFNGALHWITWELINITHYDIFSFDLATEEFKIIVPSPPLSTVFNNLLHVELGLWGGCCLCVRQWNLVTKTTDIWVLMNSKDKDIKSWTMKFKIPMDEQNIPRYYFPIALLGRDKILLYTCKVNESVFVSYNPETGNFEDEVMDNSELQPGKSNWGTCSVTPYTKSFVSLKAFREEEDAGLAF